MLNVDTTETHEIDAPDVLAIGDDFYWLDQNG
jgi:hypothetical protein